MSGFALKRLIKVKDPCQRRDKSPSSEGHCPFAAQKRLASPKIFHTGEQYEPSASDHTCKVPGLFSPFGSRKSPPLPGAEAQSHPNGLWIFGRCQPKRLTRSFLFVVNYTFATTSPQRISLSLTILRDLPRPRSDIMLIKIDGSAPSACFCFGSRSCQNYVA